MGHVTKAIVAAIILAVFGLFLIWQGLTGKVARTIDRTAIIPRWVYVVSGIGVLILPIAYLVVLLQIK
jgi:putative Mn2+ efflux pump MntP